MVFVENYVTKITSLNTCRWSQSLLYVGQITYKMYSIRLYTLYHDIISGRIINTTLIYLKLELFCAYQISEKTHILRHKVYTIS